MDSLIGLLKALRKLLAFIGNLVQLRLPEPVRARLQRVGQRSGYLRARQWLGQRRLVQALQPVWQRFVWRDYQGDHVELSIMPPDVALPLGSGLTFVGVALFMVPYATRCTFPAVDATALAAEVKQVSGVTLAVIVLGLALGMAGLLAGAARASYVALLVLLALCTFLVAGVAGRARAPGLHGLLGLSAVALALTQAGDFVRGAGGPPWSAERSAHDVTPRGMRLFLPTAALAYLGGIVLWRTSPLGLLPEPHLTILALGLWLVAVLHRARLHLTERAELGWPRAMLRGGRDLLLLALLFVAARAMLLNGPALASRLFGASPALAPMRHAVALAALAAAVHHLLSWLSWHTTRDRERICPRRLFTGCFLLALLFLLEMGRLLGASGLLHAVSESLAYATTSLWMVWYLVAVGIAFKLLKETRTVVDAVEIVAPGRFLATVSLLLLVAGLVLAFGGMLIDVGLAGWLPSTLALQLARFGLWVENLPITLYQSLVAFRPVVLGALAWLLYLALRRKLDRTRMLTATFVTLLAWFAIYEYHFELFAFARVNTGAPRTGLLFLFGLWLLWLVYSVGMRTAQGDSPRFPRVARIALFVGLLALVASSLHLQAVVKPKVLADQTFLEFFFGLVNIGLPYFLYVYLLRRYPKNSLRVHLIALAFLLGGVAQLPASLFAKLAASGCSLDGLWHTVRHIHQQITATGQFPADVRFPSAWHPLVLRVVLEEALKLLCVATVTLRMLRMTDLSRLRREGPLYAMAIGTGFASAAIIPPWFPLLPGWVIAAFYPLETFQQVDLRLAAHHLYHLLSALTFAAALVVALRKDSHRRRRLVLALLAATLISVAIRATAAILDGAHRSYLDSTGLEWVYLVAPVLVGFALFLWLERRLAPALRPTDAEPDPAPATPLVPRAHRRIAFAAAGLLLCGLALYLGHRGRSVPATAGPVALTRPATWRMEPPPPGNTLALGRELRPGERLKVLVAVSPLPREVSLKQAAEHIDRMTRAQLPDLRTLGQSEVQVGGGAALGRMLQFTLPQVGGWRLEHGCHQVLLRCANQLVILSYITAMPQFKSHHADFRRMLASVRCHC